MAQFVCLLTRPLAVSRLAAILHPLGIKLAYQFIANNSLDMNLAPEFLSMWGPINVKLHCSFIVRGNLWRCEFPPPNFMRSESLSRQQKRRFSLDA